MAVTLSPLGGVAGQFFDNNGAPLSGGLLYSYAAGTTTAQATYYDASGVTLNANPIVLDAGGRVPNEIWLNSGLSYKFVLKTSAGVLIGSWDNITGINSNFVNYAVQEQIQTATSGQTVFTLTGGLSYTPGTNTLQVFVDGVNQYDGSSYSYTETSSTVVTFTAGLHVGALVKFTTAVTLSAGVTTSNLVTYTPAGTGAVATTVQAKLRQTVSVWDFMSAAQIADVATGTPTLDCGPSFNLALNSGAVRIKVPAGTYLINTLITLPNTAYSQTLEGDDITSTTLVSGPSTTTNMILNNRGYVGSFTIRNMRFTAGTGFTGFAINCNTHAGISWIIEDCWASMGSSASGFFTGGLSNSFIQGCQFELQQICFNLVGNGNGQTTFTNNAITAGYGSFIYAVDSNTKNVCSVNGLSCSELYKGDLINVNNAQGWIISNVNYQDDLTYASASNNTSRGIVLTNSNNCIINDCNIVVFPGTTQNHIAAGFSISNSQVQINNSSVIGAIWGFELTGTGVNYVDLIGVNLHQCNISFRNSQTSTGRFTATACRWDQAATFNVVWNAVGSIDFIAQGCQIVDAQWNASVNGIGIDVNTSGAFELRSCTIGRTNANSKQAYFLNNEGTGTLLLTGNTIVGSAINAFNTGTELIKSSGSYGLGLSGFYMGSSIPSIGTWNLGDVMFNSTPAVGSPKAWTCTVAGTPGTWVSQGNL